MSHGASIEGLLPNLVSRTEADRNGCRSLGLYEEAHSSAYVLVLVVAPLR